MRTLSRHGEQAVAPTIPARRTRMASVATSQPRQEPARAKSSPGACTTGPIAPTRPSTSRCWSLYLQGAVLPGDAGLTRLGLGHRHHHAVLGHSCRPSWAPSPTPRPTSAPGCSPPRCSGAGASALDVLRHARAALVVRGDVSDRQFELRAGAKFLQRLSARDRRRRADERSLGLGLRHRLRRRRADAAGRACCLLSYGESLGTADRERLSCRGCACC